MEELKKFELPKVDVHYFEHVVEEDMSEYDGDFEVSKTVYTVYAGSEETAEKIKALLKATSPVCKFWFDDDGSLRDYIEEQGLGEVDFMSELVEKIKAELGCEYDIVLRDSNYFYITYRIEW